MLEVLPIGSVDKQQAFCEKNNIEFFPDSMAYAAFYDGKAIGICQFEVLSGVGVIRSISNLDEKLDVSPTFLMLRAVLNFLDSFGTRKVEINLPNIDDTLLISAGFEKNNDGIYSLFFANFP